MQKKDTVKELFEFACNLLKYRDRSVFEIKEKLREKKSAEKNIDKVVKKLIELNYLNEQRFVENYVNKWISKGKSLNFILYELKEKYKVNNEIIDKLDIDNLKHKLNDIVEQIIKKKFGKNDREKIYKFLQYKGFSEDEIEFILSKL